MCQRGVFEVISRSMQRKSAITTSCGRCNHTVQMVSSHITKETVSQTLSYFGGKNRENMHCWFLVYLDRNYFSKAKRTIVKLYRSLGRFNLEKIHHTNWTDTPVLKHRDFRQHFCWYTGKRLYGGHEHNTNYVNKCSLKGNITFFSGIGEKIKRISMKWIK